MRDKIPHGRWGSYIERNFDLSIKTANIWIRAWENRDSELALRIGAAYMRELYGNEPKSFKAAIRKWPEEMARRAAAMTTAVWRAGLRAWSWERPSLLIKANRAFMGSKTSSLCSTTTFSRVRRSRAKRS